MKAQVPQITHYVVLGIAFILAAATLSIAPPSRAATSAAYNVATGTASPDWTTYMQGNDRSGFTSDSGFNPTSVKSLHLAWRASDTAPNHGVFSQPVVSNGLVYWGSFDGREHASTTAGKLVWQRNLGTTSPPACTDPSEAGVATLRRSRLTFRLGPQRQSCTSAAAIQGVRADAASGAVLWSHSVGGNPNTFVWSSPAVFGNSVYIGVASFGTCPDVQARLLQLSRVTGALSIGSRCSPAASAVACGARRRLMPPRAPSTSPPVTSPMQASGRTPAPPAKWPRRLSRCAL